MADKAQDEMAFAEQRRMLSVPPEEFERLKKRFESHDVGKVMLRMQKVIERLHLEFIDCKTRVLKFGTLEVSVEDDCTLLHEEAMACVKLANELMVEVAKDRGAE